MKQINSSIKTMIVIAVTIGVLYAVWGRESRADRRSGGDGTWQVEYDGLITEKNFYVLRDIAADFFKGLSTKGSKVEDTMAVLYNTAYPLEPKGRQEAFTKKIQGVITALGQPETFNFVSLRALENTKRYYVMHFLTYHGKNSATAWEFEFVRVKAKWQVRNIRFNFYDPMKLLNRLGNPKVQK